MLESTSFLPLEKYKEHVRPSLGRLMEILALDYSFEGGQGDLLKGFDPQGKPVRVYDFLGGYGSTILGHNHPVILQKLSDLIVAKAVFHAQASVRVQSALLGERLNQVLKEKTKETRNFKMTAANSGAEAVEIAIKHALLQWQNKKKNFILRLQQQKLSKAKNNSELLLKYENYIQEIEAAEPLLLALTGGFHGKTAAAVMATANPSYGKMYSQKAIDVHFLPREKNEKHLECILNETDLIWEEGRKNRFSRLIGFIFEPIQGEGGIEVLPVDWLKTIEIEMNARNIPMIADEIQSGLYRTGYFLSSSLLDMKPDYILLGKSLGGGLAKISCALIAADHYQEEFGWLHTSTFAEDDWASALALTSLEFLVGNEILIQKQAIEFENRIRECVEELQTRHPGLISKFKGRGFFLGIQFNFEDEGLHSDLLRGLYENGHATYLMSSYLLKHHAVRVGATLSAGDTLRIEPSAFVGPEAVNRLCEALEDLCRILSERRMAQLMNHLWRRPLDREKLQVISPAGLRPTKEMQALPQVGFLSHILDIPYLRNMDPALAAVDEKDLKGFLDSYLPYSGPFRYHRQVVHGANGEKVVLNLYGLYVASYQFEQDLRSGQYVTLEKVQAALDLAAEHGCTYFGLGQFSSIVSYNGLMLKQSILTTTGNSLTAGMAFLAIKKIIKERFNNRSDLRIGVVGFSGNICHVVTQLLADLGHPMTLVHREPYATSERFQASVASLLENSKAKIEDLTLAHDISAIKNCDVVLVGTNSSQEFIRAEHIKDHAVLLDISVPTNVHSEVRKLPNILYFQGGFARFPFDQRVQHHWVPAHESKNWFACMTETLACGLVDFKEAFSLGGLTKERVLLSIEMSEKLGISVGDLRCGN